jgi:hypothetical protein
MEVVEVRVKLEVSLILAAAAATLFGVIVPGCPDGLDVLNDPSARPIPGGITQLGGRRKACKGGAFSFCCRPPRFLQASFGRIRRDSYRCQMVRAREKRSWPRRSIAASSQTG